MRSETFAGILTAAGCLWWLLWAALWTALLGGAVVLIFKHVMA